MKNSEALEILATYWDDVVGHLGARERDALIARARNLLEAAGAAERGEAAMEILDVVVPALPADHPVRRALAREGTKFGGGAESWDQALRLLAACVTPAALGSGQISDLSAPQGGSRDEQVIRALGEHWASVGGLLSAGTLRYLAELAERAAQAPPGEARGVAAELVRVLGQVLPEGDHPVRRALEVGDHRTATATAAWPAIARTLLRQIDEGQQARAGAPGASAPSPGEVMFWASRYLLAEAALSEDQVRELGQDPADSGLIRLDRDDGSEQWPDFQFGPDGAPLPVVRAINRLLDAEDDPWGVADWWFGHNQWLGGAPARLIGEIDDDVLIAAARAVDPGV